MRARYINLMHAYSGMALPEVPGGLDVHKNPRSSLLHIYF